MAIAPHAPAAAPVLARSFHVSIHDVTPCFAHEVREALDRLSPLVGTALSAAVVPCWHGTPLDPRDGAFAALVRDRADEIVLHGWSHRQERRAGAVSLLTGGADEFSRLSADDARDRIRRGRDVLASVLGRAPDGFLPPAYQSGALRDDDLRTAGIGYLVGWSRVAFAHGVRIPLATWCWDVSDLAALGPLAEFAGNAARIGRDALPCVAIHPRDVARGHLDRAVARVRRLLAEGRRPVLLRDLAALSRMPA